MTAFVSLSGGLDSSMGLALAVAGHGEQNVVAVSFDYGQRHLRELESARQVAAHLNVEHRIVDLKGMLTGSALLGEGEIPLGHYAEDSMSVTVVHGRNLLFVSTIVAMTRPGDEVWLSVHAGDHYVYPDCRPEFVVPLQNLLFKAYDVTLRAPYLYQSKTQIARDSATFPGIAALSWSCYEGAVIHCGACGTCFERREAFEQAGIEDPTEYLARPHYEKP